MGLKKKVSTYQVPLGFVHDQGYLKSAALTAENDVLNHRILGFYLLGHAHVVTCGLSPSNSGYGDGSSTGSGLVLDLLMDS